MSTKTDRVEGKQRRAMQVVILCVPIGWVGCGISLGTINPLLAFFWISLTLFVGGIAGLIWLPAAHDQIDVTSDARAARDDKGNALPLG